MRKINNIKTTCMFAGGVHNLVNTETYTCDGISSDQPISNKVIVCKMNGTNEFRVDSADR